MNIIVILLVCLFNKENLYLKSYFSGSKIGINALIRTGLCAGVLYEGGGGLYIRGVTQVLRRTWIYPWGGIYAGGGLIGSEIRD